MDAIRTGSRTTAVTMRAIDGGIFEKGEFAFGCGGWLFKDWLALRREHQPLATARESLTSFNPPNRRLRR